MNPAKNSSEVSEVAGSLTPHGCSSLSNDIAPESKGVTLGRSKVSGLEVKNTVDSYVNGIALTIFDGDRIIDIGRMVAKGAEIMREVAEADRIPLELEKGGILFLEGKEEGRKGVKRLGIILHSELKIPGPHHHESKESETNAGEPKWPRQQLLGA